MTPFILFLARLWFYLDAWGYALAVAVRKLMALRKRQKQPKSLRELLLGAIRRLGRIAVSLTRYGWKLAARIASSVRSFLESLVLRLAASIADAICNFFSFLRRLALQAKELVRVGARKLLRRIEAFAVAFDRAHHQILYQTNFRLFEWLKRSRKKEAVLKYYERLMAHRTLSANDLSGLIALSLDAKQNALCRKFIDALFAGHPVDYEVHKGAAIRCFHRGEYEEAFDIWTRSEDNRADDVARQGLDKLELRFLGPSWFLVIGHIAHLDTYFKHQVLSGSTAKRYVPLIPLQMPIHNPYFLDLWREAYFTEPMPVLDPTLTLDQIIALTDEFWNIRFAPGETHMFSLAGARVQQAWASSGRPPLIGMPQEDVEKCWDAMERLGVPRGSWFACLHVREPGFHGAWNKKHPATRDADIDTYNLAIEAVLQRGGHVIRMGDPTMKPLGPRAGVVDYAHEEAKSDMMDIFLCSHCSFFIGTNSGLSMVPPVFGKPCALTNWSPIAIQNWFPADLFIPKHIQRVDTGEYLGFEEQFSTPIGWQQFADYFEDNGLRLVDNTPEELRDVVVEMMDRIEGNAGYDSSGEKLQESFRNISVAHSGYIGGRIGRDFIREYKSLL